MKVLFIFTSIVFLLDPSKQIVLKMAYIRKTTYNIGGSIIPSTLSIPLNKLINDFKPLHDERCDVLIKKMHM